MVRTAIVFGKGMLVSRAPNDYLAQWQLIENRLLFDSHGNPVTSHPNEPHGRSLNGGEYYCIPLRSIVQLMWDITVLLHEKTGDTVELIFADPSFYTDDSAPAYRCLRHAFGDQLPAGFVSTYWQGVAADVTAAHLIETIRDKSRADRIVLITSDALQPDEVSSDSTVVVVKGEKDLCASTKISHNLKLKSKI